jgi:hypothetical protein
MLAQRSRRKLRAGKACEGLAEALPLIKAIDPAAVAKDMLCIPCATSLAKVQKPMFKYSQFERAAHEGE